MCLFLTRRALAERPTCGIQPENPPPLANSQPAQASIHLPCKQTPYRQILYGQILCRQTSHDQHYCTTITTSAASQPSPSLTSTRTEPTSNRTIRLSLLTHPRLDLISPASADQSTPSRHTRPTDQQPNSLQIVPDSAPDSYVPGHPLASAQPYRLAQPYGTVLPLRPPLSVILLPTSLSSSLSSSPLPLLPRLPPSTTTTSTSTSTPPPPPPPPPSGHRTTTARPPHDHYTATHDCWCAVFVSESPTDEPSCTSDSIYAVTLLSPLSRLPRPPRLDSLGKCCRSRRLSRRYAGMPTGSLDAGHHQLHIRRYGCSRGGSYHISIRR